MGLAKRTVSFIISILLLPLPIAAAIAFYGELEKIGSISGENLYFIWGILGYVVLNLFISKLDYLYIFGHEVVHSLATFLCGGKVKSFKVTRRGGAVKTTKTNLFIELSPYFVPIYTVISGLLYLSSSVFNVEKDILPYFLFAIGFTLSFHIILTSEKIRLKQPDFLRLGHMFSIIMIVTFNIILAEAIVDTLFGEIYFIDFLTSLGMHTKMIYGTIFTQLFL